MRQPKQPRALGPVAAPQVFLSGALQIADGAQPVAGKALLGDLADAEDQRHGSRGEEGGCLAAAEHGKAAWLVEIGRDLGQELILREPDGHGNTERVFDLAGKAGKRLGRRHPMQPRRAGKVHEGLVDRHWLDQRRELEHEFAHLAPNPRVFVHVRAHHRGLRAQPPGLEHGHG